MRTIILLFCISCAFPLNISTGLTNSYSVVPGKTIEAKITVVNSSNKIEKYYLEVKDYQFSSDGRNRYQDPPSHSRSNAKWFNLPEQIIVPPNQSYDVLFNIQIPSDSKLDGTFWSIVKIGNVHFCDLDEKKKSVGVSINTEYGVQIITSFPKGESMVSFSDSQLLDEENTQFVVNIENTGSMWLRPTLKIQLYDLTGKFIGIYEGSNKRLFPETSAKFVVDLPDLEKQTYKALVVADCGEDKIFAASYNLEF